MKQDLSFHLHILQSEQEFLLPDVIVYVTASQSTINQRITQRSEKVPMQWYGDKVSLEYNLDESYKLIQLIQILSKHILICAANYTKLAKVYR